MLYPSIDKLLTKVDSKYRLVKIVTQRSKQMELDANYYLDSYKSCKDIGKALEEVEADLITFEEE